LFAFQQIRPVTTSEHFRLDSQQFSFLLNYTIKTRILTWAITRPLVIQRLQENIMVQNDAAKAAFEKIISNGRTLSIKKAAKAYWDAYESEAGASDEAGLNLEKAIKSIPLDYRQPTVKFLEDLDNCKQGDSDNTDCYLAFAVAIVDKIVSLG